ISGTGLGLLRQAPFLQLSTPATQREGIGVGGGGWRKGGREGGAGGRDGWVEGGGHADGGGGGGTAAIVGGGGAGRCKETEKEGQCGVREGEERIEGVGETGDLEGETKACSSSSRSSSSSSSGGGGGVGGWKGLLSSQAQLLLVHDSSAPEHGSTVTVLPPTGHLRPGKLASSPTSCGDAEACESGESGGGGAAGFAGEGGVDQRGTGAGGAGAGMARVGYALNEGLLRASQRRLRVDVHLLWRFLQILCLQLREGLRGAASTPIATVTSGRNRSERLAHLFPESLRTRFEAPLFIYTEEKAYLAMSEAAKEMVGVRSVNKSIPAHNRCFGAWWKSVLVDLVVGYDTILMNSLISSRGKGFLYNAHTKELYDLNLAATRGRAAATSFEDVISFKIGVVFTSVFIFFMTLLAVSFTLRETQSRMLKFTSKLMMSPCTITRAIACPPFGSSPCTSSSPSFSFL
ncbi:hypothetical protein CLOP_g17967, partial [Closterium sp. NIES-67]